jgi:hypothetical protein
VGGYGPLNTGKVQETFNALDDAPSWSNIWNVANLGSIPCYDVVIDAMDPSGATIVLGTEYGVFATDNGGDDWILSNQNMSSTASQITAPVFDLKQQWRGAAQWINPSNQGAIYAATHGRGIFRSDLFLGTDNPMEENVSAAQPLQVYPNPVNGSSVTIQSDAMRGDFQMQVFDLTGRLSVDQRIQSYMGTPLVLDVAGLQNGTYIVRLTNGQFQQTSKMLIRR